MKIIEKYSIQILIVFLLSAIIKPVICFLILGLLLLFYSSDYLLFFNKIKKSGIECIGKIVSFESDDGYKIPIIAFKTLDEKIISKTPFYYATTDLSVFLSYTDEINKNISVIYDSDNPEKFVIKSENEFNYGSLIFMILISLIFMIISIYLILGFIDFKPFLKL